MFNELFYLNVDQLGFSTTTSGKRLVAAGGSQNINVGVTAFVFVALAKSLADELASLAMINF